MTGSVKSKWRAKAAIALFVTLVASLLAGAAAAHEIRPTIATIDLETDGSFTLDVSVNLEALIAALGPDHRESSTAPNAGQYNRLRELPADDLRAAYDDFAEEFRDGILITDDKSSRIPLTQESVTIEPIGDTNVQRTSLVVFSGKVPAGATSIVWTYKRDFGPSAIRAKPADGEIFYSDYVLSGDSSGEIGLDTVVRQSKLSVFLNYLHIGFQHIVPLGVDHILFVAGLFLLSPHLRPLLWQVTCFTLAHSVTLALGGLGLLNVPDTIVQPLVALSIVYVGVENVRTEKLTRWRPVVVFLFGLLHGLGFASVLREIAPVKGDFIVGLVGFNLGVELGQLTIVGGCFFMFGLWFGEKAWYRAVVTIPVSLLIAAIAAFWFVERVA